MTTLDAIYENGTFRPVSGDLPVFKEHEKVRLTIETQADQRPEPAHNAFSQELWQHLYAEGVITHVPAEVSSDGEDDFEPIEIDGEPISETIIRERG